VSRRAPAAPLALAAALAVGAGWAGSAPASAATPVPPQISARTAVVIQPDTRDVVYAKGAEVRRPIASTTKLMTALLALEKLDLSDVLRAAPYHPSPAESIVGLRTGERMTVADLLRALLLPSANDAAETLAVGIAGSRKAFVRMMNERAKQLGLKNTHYANPIGLDAPGNYSSAQDLVQLALILRRNPFFVTTTNQPKAILRSGSRRRVVVNRNTLVQNVPVVNGVKTGHTSGAGYVLVGSATRDGITVLSAVLGDPSESTRDSDSLNLIRYGLDSYHRVTAVKARRRYVTVKVKHQSDDVASLVATETSAMIARRGEKIDVRVVGAPDELEGPIPAGTREGTLEVRQRGKVVARIALVTARDVPEASIGERARTWLGRTLTIVLLGALAICSLQLVLLRRRAVRKRRRAAQQRQAHPPEAS